jgi:hypothetical protein
MTADKIWRATNPVGWSTGGLEHRWAGAPVGWSTGGLEHRWAGAPVGWSTGGLGSSYLGHQLPGGAVG